VGLGHSKPKKREGDVRNIKYIMKKLMTKDHLGYAGV
jgi:hypothetical protein